VPSFFYRWLGLGLWNEIQRVLNCVSS